MTTQQLQELVGVKIDPKWEIVMLADESRMWKKRDGKWYEYSNEKETSRG